MLSRCCTLSPVLDSQSVSCEAKSEYYRVESLADFCRSPCILSAARTVLTCPGAAPAPVPAHDDRLRGKPNFLSEAHGPSTVARQQRCHRASAPARRPFCPPMPRPVRSGRHGPTKAGSGPHYGTELLSTRGDVCLLLQDLYKSCARGGGVKRGDVCYGMLRAAACVDESDHHALMYVWHGQTVREDRVGEASARRP